MLGGDGEAVEAALGKLNGEGQKLKVAGIDPAFVKLDEEQPEIVARINAAKPDILFVALGNPKQELWMGRNAAKLRVDHRLELLLFRSRSVAGFGEYAKASVLLRRDQP